jgi:hypothetical protein
LQSSIVLLKTLLLIPVIGDSRLVVWTRYDEPILTPGWAKAKEAKDELNLHCFCLTVGADL